MKRVILIIGILLIALNTIIGLAITDYATFNFLLADLSIALSVGLLYFIAVSKMANGFKIGLTVFCFFAGIASFLCVAFASPGLENNILLLAALCILFFEIVCVITAKTLSKNK